MPTAARAASLRTWAILAGSAGLALGLILTPWMAAIWAWNGGEGGFEESFAHLRAIGPWLLDSGHLTHEDGAPLAVWTKGPGRGFFLVPLASIPAIEMWRRQAHSPGARRAGRVTSLALALSAIPVFTGYWLNGIGWPLDPLLMLIALIATIAWGVTHLRAGRRAIGGIMISALPLTVISFIYADGYAPPAMLLGLTTVWLALAAWPMPSAAATPPAAIGAADSP